MFPWSFYICNELKEKVKTINALVQLEIKDNFLLPPKENLFNDELIFQDNNASCLTTKDIKAFLLER